MTHDSHPPINRLNSWGYRLSVLAGVTALAGTLYWTNQPEPTPPVYAAQQNAPDFATRKPEAFLDALRQIINSGKIDEEFIGEWADLMQYPIHIDVWKPGQFVGESVSFGLTPADSIIELHDNLRQLSGNDAVQIDDDAKLVLTMFYHPRQYDELSAKAVDGVNKFVRPGQDGLFVDCNDTHILMPNIRWATRGYATAWQAAQVYLKWVGCEKDELEAGLGGITAFDTLELVQHGKGSVPQPWSGGDRLIAPETVGRAQLELFAKDSSDYLLRHLTAEGAEPYIYDALNDMYNPENQVIRQWFATLALGMQAEASGDSELKNAFLRNVNYNITTFYEQNEDGRGYMVHNYRAPLAASAVAMLALDIANRHSPNLFADQYQGLLKGVLAQRKGDGFDTTILPLVETGNDMGFAPGITLAALAQAKQNGQEIEADALLGIAKHYHDFWKGNRDYNSILWHLVGMGELYFALETPPQWLRDAIFEQADELVGCLQGSNAPVQLQGALNSATCPIPSPRPMSSAVATEGLVEAYRVAVTEKDRVRIDRYGRAIESALRFVLQGSIDLENNFYLKNPDRALNGMRFTLHEPYVRVDAPGHAIIAVHRALEHVTLSR